MKSQGKDLAVIDGDDFDDIYQSEVNEDFYTKFNEIAGWQSLLLLQFQFQTSVAIISGLYMAYIITLSEATFALGTKLENIPIQIYGTSTSTYR